MPTFNTARNIQYLNNTMFVVNGDVLTYYSDSYDDYTGYRNLYFLKLEDWEVVQFRLLDAVITEPHPMLETYILMMVREENLVTIPR